MKSFDELVKNELQSARSLHNSPIHSVHEGYSVLLEELDEVWDEIKKKKRNRNLANLLKELVQVGSMAQRLAEDVVMPTLYNE